MLKTRSCTAGSNQNIITESEASKMDGSNEAGEASLEKGVKENIETKEKSLQKPTNEKALDTVGESLNSKTDEFQNMLMLDNADDNDDEDEDIELILLLTRNSKSTRKQKRVLRMILCLKNAFEIPSKLEITEEEVNKKRGERIQATHCCHQVRPWCY